VVYNPAVYCIEARVEISLKRKIIKIAKCGASKKTT
jgi:hypothetical protein